MLRDLAKFTAKVVIFVALVRLVIMPHIPGMPNWEDLIHLPSWQQVGQFLLDPADTIGKSGRLIESVQAKLPSANVGGKEIKPHVPHLGQSPKDFAKDTLDPAGIFH